MTGGAKGLCSEQRDHCKKEEAELLFSKLFVALSLTLCSKTTQVVLKYVVCSGLN